MPHKREGAVKVSDHWVPRSPLLNISRACQNCHPHAETELQARVDAIQAARKVCSIGGGAAPVDMLDAVAAARKAGAKDAQLAAIFALQRKAQWRLGFHCGRELDIPRAAGSPLACWLKRSTLLVRGSWPPRNSRWLQRPATDAPATASGIR